MSRGVSAVSPVVARAPRPEVSPAIRRMSEAATDRHYALPSGTMVIPALGAPAARRPARARWAGISGGIAVVLALALAFTVLRLTTPAGAGHASLAGLAADAGGSPGATGRAAIGGPPAWQASAGAVEVLGAGGAAAPGVTAPGTAGAPVTASAPTASAPTAAPTASAPTAVPATTAAHPAPTPTAPRPAATATPRPKPTPTAPPRPTPTPATSIRPAPVSPWPPANEWMPVPGYTPYAVSDPPNDPYTKAFGQCTWYAQYRRPNENLRGMGNAMYWAANASARGYRVGDTPAVGATVVFQPGVQGASGVGHVAHVLILYPDGWFLIAEMNAYGNGGGWGRVSFRYAHTGPGVSFIY
jgi:surface antigen